VDHFLRLCSCSSWHAACSCGCSAAMLLLLLHSLVAKLQQLAAQHAALDTMQQ
jgi:hypothetical protein